jgi:hypothetical protein
MSWVGKLSTTSISSTVWSGTNIPQTTGGLTLTKIYTTIGTKTINAVTTYGKNIATCSGTVKVISGGGGGGEI